MRRAWPIAAALVLSTVLAGCTTQNPNETSPSATPSPLPTAPHGLINEDTQQTIAPDAEAVWDDESRAAATAAATKAMTAFARPKLDHDTWWAELSPLLNQQAREDYAYVQPQAIPASSVTGPAKITDDSSALVVHVSVPTNVGAYDVILNRVDGASPWLAARFTPPEGVR